MKLYLLNIHHTPTLSALCIYIITFFVSFIHKIRLMVMFLQARKLGLRIWRNLVWINFVSSTWDLNLGMFVSEVCFLSVRCSCVFLLSWKHTLQFHILKWFFVVYENIISRLPFDGLLWSILLIGSLHFVPSFIHSARFSVIHLLGPKHICENIDGSHFQKSKKTTLCHGCKRRLFWVHYLLLYQRSVSP